MVKVAIGSDPARLPRNVRARLAAVSISVLPGQRPAHWMPSHRLGSSSKPPISPPLPIQALPPGLLAALALREESFQLDERHHDAGMAACHACGVWERAHALLAAAALRRSALLPETYALGMQLFEATFLTS